MRIDVLARNWGSPAGGPNGMAIAAAFLACTLGDLGHQVRRLSQPDGFAADLVITTISPTWRRVVAEALAARARDRLVYWHHAGGVPVGNGCLLAAPPAVGAQPGWARQVVLPPSSWAAEAGGEPTGGDILVTGAGPAKGGHVALEVARLCPDLRWYVLRGRSAPSDRDPWGSIPHAEVAQDVVEPEHLLSRARAVLSPTRFETYGLTMVEAAVRGIPVVCTDLPATRAALGESAMYVPVTAPAEEWATALRESMRRRLPRLQLRPYADVVRQALAELQGMRAAA